MFNSISFHAPRLPLNYLFRGFTRPMFRMDQADRDVRADKALNGLTLIEARFPDLAVSWAASMVPFTRRGSALENEAIDTVLEYLEPAYRLDPARTRRAVLLAGLACKDRRLEARLNHRFYEVAPHEAPGPWGPRPKTREQWEQDWWAGASFDKRVSLIKHRLRERFLHRPGPDDITISGTFDDEPKP